MKDTSGPAFPEVSGFGSDNSGLTKREWFAGKFLAHLLQNETAVFGDQSEVQNKVGAAIHYADALLAELNKE